jgi:hypothetical protein
MNHQSLDEPPPPDEPPPKPLPPDEPPEDPPPPMTAPRISKRISRKAPRVTIVRKTTTRITSPIIARIDMDYLAAGAGVEPKSILGATFASASAVK